MSEQKQATPKGKAHLLQDPFLNTIRKERIPVSIYLASGTKLAGTIESFDSYVLILCGEGVTQMVYKHLIASIKPDRKVQLPTAETTSPEKADAQGSFLQVLAKEKACVNIFLAKGTRLTGIMIAFDQYVIILDGAVPQMIYKHSIATVVPA